MALVKCVALLLLLQPAWAYPGQLPAGGCRAWAAGETGYMSSATLGSGAGGACSITVKGGATQVAADTDYTVTVSATTPSLYKLYSTDGQCVGSDANSGLVAASKDFVWRSPSSIPAGGIAIHALCGSSYSSVLAASAVTLNPAPAPPSSSPVAAPVSAPSPPTASPMSGPSASPMSGPSSSPMPAPSTTKSVKELKPCTAMEMKAMMKMNMTDEEMKMGMKMGKITCMPSMGNMTDGMEGQMKNCSAKQLLELVQKSEQEIATMMKGGKAACTPGMQLPTLKDCSEAESKAMQPIWAKEPSDEEQWQMVVNGTIGCKPQMPNLPNCTPAQFLAVLKKEGKMPNAEEMGKMVMAGKMTCLPGDGTFPDLPRCSAEQSKKMMMEMITGKGAMAQLMGLLTGGGGMGAIMGMIMSMMGATGGGMNMGGGMATGSGMAAGGGMNMGGGMSMTTAMPKGGTKDAMSTAMPKSGMKDAMTTAMPKDGMSKEGGGMSSGGGMSNAMNMGVITGLLEMVTSGNLTCLPGDMAMADDSKLEKPSKETQEKASKLLDGCRAATCLAEAEKALSDAGGLSEKAQKTYLNQLAGNAAKDAARDGVKDCLAPGKTDAQKKECFDAARQKLGVDALLGNRSEAVKAKVQEELAKEAARDALGDSFSSCLKGGSDKKACLSQVSADLAAAGLEGESPRSIRDNLLRRKLQEAAEDCSNATCRQAAKQAAVAAGMEPREYAAVKALGDIKAAAEIYASCQLAGTEESECAAMAKADWVASSGADATAFTEELAARVKKLGAAIVSGIPVKLVRLKRMVATVLVAASSCEDSLKSWFAAQCLDRAKAKQSKAEGAKAKDCIVVDAKAQYSASVNVDATDDEIDTVSAHVAGSFEGETLGQASAARRLLSAARRLATVDETYASQDVAECSEEDSACLAGEPSNSAASPSGAPASTPAPTTAPTPAPTPPPTTAPAGENVAAGAAGRSLGVLAALAASAALQQ